MSKEEYIKNYYKHLLAQSKKLFDKENAEEAVHILIEHILSDKFKYNGSYKDIKSINNYCWGILLNKQRDFIRKEKKNKSIEFIDYYEIKSMDIERDPLETFYQYELSCEGLSDDQIQKIVRIKSYIRKLSPHNKRLYDLYFIQEKTYREISKIVKIPLTSVFVLIKKLKHKLVMESKKPQKPIY